jgi:hypothetical protein
MIQKFQNASNPGELAAAMAIITDLAQRNQLTIPNLNEAMAATFDEGTGQWHSYRSIGLRWLCANPQLFARAALSAGLKVEEFLSEHLAFRSTRDHDKFLRDGKNLTDLAGAKLVTRALLDEAMAAIFDDGDYYDRSIGFEWLVHNPALFAQVAEQCGFAVREFLLAHENKALNGNRILLYSEILKLIPAAEREQFARDMYARHGCLNNGWIRHLREVGVGPATAAEMILGELERAEANHKGPDCNYAVKSFLEYGSSEHEGKNAPWAVLSKDQLKKAMAICSRLAGNLFFTKRAEIEKWLGKEHFAALGREVVLRGGMFTSAQHDFVAEQSLDFQLKVAESLVIAPGFIISLMLQLDEARARELYAKKAAAFNEVHLATLYRTTWERRNPGGKPVHAWLEAELERRLTDQGFIIAAVQEGSFQPKGHLTPKRQFFVDIKGHRYVMSNRQTGYTPKPGEVVIFNTNNGHPLKPNKVTAVIMVPAHRDTKVRMY